METESNYTVHFIAIRCHWNWEYGKELHGHCIQLVRLRIFIVLAQCTAHLHHRHLNAVLFIILPYHVIILHMPRPSTWLRSLIKMSTRTQLCSGHEPRALWWTHKLCILYTHTHSPWPPTHPVCWAWVFYNVLSLISNSACTALCMTRLFFVFVFIFCRILFNSNW